MSKKLDFSIAVKLAAENFNKGIKGIQSQLNNFKKMAIIGTAYQKWFKTTCSKRSS